MTLLEPDRDQLEIFVEALFRHSGSDGWISMRAFYEGDGDGAPPFRTTPTRLAGGLPFVIDVAEDDARRAANDPKPVVFCPPLAIFNNEKHAREVDLLKGPALTIECDANPQAARSKLEQVIGPATLVVRSGGQWTDPTTREVHDKVHLHWRLNRPASGEANLKKLKQARALATRLVGGDHSNIPICHPIRWPGSWHRKNAPRLCAIVEQHPDIEIDLDTTIAALRAFVPDPPPTDDDPDDDKRERERTDWDKYFGLILSGESYHPTLTPLAASFAAHGMPRASAYKVLRGLVVNSEPADAERMQRRRVELGKLTDTVRSAYAKFERSLQPRASELFNPWARYIAPDFPLDVLPPVLRDFVSSQSTVIGACPAGMAMSALTVVGAAASHRWSLKMMEHGDWYEHPRLWVLLVGDPSVKKTPEINAAAAPLQQLQAELYAAYKQAICQYEAAREAGDKDVAEPEAPPRYVAMDATIQKLGEIIARTDRGLLVKRDELTGWIGDMDRYNKAAHAISDRAFWLQAWDGGPYHVDRIGRGEIFIKNLSVSILGGIQPGRLAELKDLTTDGLLQRFLPIMMTQSSFTLDEPVNVNPYWALIRQLVDMSPQHLSMTDTARGKLTDLRGYLHGLEQNSGGIAGGFQSFIGKLAGYSGRLAIVLHLSEFANERFIGGKVIDNVHRLVVDFLIPHAFEFYAAGEAGDQLKRLASYVLTCGKDRILASDLTTNVRDLRGLSLFEVRERASVLVAGGWLEPIDRTPVCRAWRVNPAVRVRFAEQARKEAERKRIIVDMLHARKRTAAT